ncbi:hypothetical protein TNCV_4226301 [Trichonephila clavipes]|uniref:Uncharacterized protein n=1 Tax=Trichonephila clavipes TaxID=2585209 RepID=A0A8X6T3E1_TRICX|nr:hypothetical protein TNCV_4226301 [Trichonephila clavipes]
MFPSGSQSEVKPPVFSSQSSLILLYLPTEGISALPSPRENAMANTFWVSVRNNISKRWNTTENDVFKNQSSADSAIRLPNTKFHIKNLTLPNKSCLAIHHPHQH